MSWGNCASRRLLVLGGIAVLGTVSTGTASSGDASLESGSSAPQEPSALAPGDPRLDGGSIVPFVARYQVWIESEGERTPAQVWTRSLQLVSVAGVEAIDETWRLQFEQGTVYDQSIYERRTFRPLMKRILSWRGNDIIDFTGAVPRYTFVPLVDFTDEPGSSRDLEPIDGERFAGGSNFALATLDLEVGQRFRIPSIDTDPGIIGSLRETEIVVKGRERIIAVERTFETFEVGAPDGGSSWLAQQPPYVVRRRFGDRVWELTALSLLSPGR